MKREKKKKKTVDRDERGTDEAMAAFIHTSSA